MGGELLARGTRARVWQPGTVGAGRGVLRKETMQRAALAASSDRIFDKDCVG